MLSKAVWLSALACLFLTQSDAQDAAKKDLQRLQGTWTMAALEVDGKDVGAEKVKDTTLTIMGDRYSVKAKDNVNSCVIRLDPKANPPAIDMIFTAPDGGEKIHKGIYKIEGDAFRVCRGLNADQPRPDQLATWPNTGYFVVTWKKQ